MEGKLCLIWVLVAYEQLCVLQTLTATSLLYLQSIIYNFQEYLDAQDRESRKLSISVARCYPMKNRIPDVMPCKFASLKLSSQLAKNFVVIHCLRK